MTRKEYFEHPAISRGLLQKFKKSATTGKRLLESPPKDSKAMSFGRAFHAYLEDDEGQAFYNEFYVFDDSDKIIEIGGAKPRATKAYKEWKEKELIIANGRELLSYEDFNEVVNMADSVFALEFYQKTVREAKSVGYEKAYTANIEGKEYKALADCAIEGDNDVIVIDWKKTRADLDNEGRAAKREIWKWDLHLQVAHYSKVIQAATGKPVIFVFVFVEDHSGNEAQPVVISEESDLMTDGRILWDRCNNNYEKYLAGDFNTLASELENGILILE